TEPIHTFKLNPSIQHQLRFILWNFPSLFQPTNAFGALKTYVRHDLTFQFATSFMNPFLTPCTEYGVISDSFTTNTTRIFAGFLNYTGTKLTFHYLCLPYVYFQSL